jgi:hypothetical protein
MSAGRRALVQLGGLLPVALSMVTLKLENGHVAEIHSFAAAVSIAITGLLCVLIGIDN